MTALISGASRGLGRALCVEFTRRGIDVIGVSRDANGLDETGATCHGLPGSFDGRSLDVRDDAAVTELVSSVPALSYCIVNAGVASMKPFLDTTTTELVDLFEVNVFGAFSLMREAARRMRSDGGGRIVVIASDAAFRGIPGMSAYVASKHAVFGLAKTLDLEMGADGIQVTTVLPGPIATTILGEPDPSARLMDSAETAVAIASVLVSSGTTTRISELHLMPWKDSHVQ